MHSRSLLAFVLLTLFPHCATAQQQCAVDGGTFVDGASYCFSAVRDGKLQRIIFTCKNGAWTQSNALCPDHVKSFCQAGEYSIRIGDELVLGLGPDVIKCQFPGVWSRVEGSGSEASPVKSKRVRD